MQANTYIHVSLKAVQYRSRVKQYWRKANFVPRPFPFARGYLCINDCSSTTVASTLDFWGSFSQMRPSHVVYRTRVPLLSLLGYVNCMLPITTSLFCFQQKRLSRRTLCYLATKLYLRQTKPFISDICETFFTFASDQWTEKRECNTKAFFCFVLITE